MTLDAQINAAELSHFDRTELVTKSLRYWELHHKVFCEHAPRCYCAPNKAELHVFDGDFYGDWGTQRLATSAEADEMIAELEERCDAGD